MTDYLIRCITCYTPLKTIFFKDPTNADVYMCYACARRHLLSVGITLQVLEICNIESLINGL